jgi:SRSO17 transposase
MTTDVLRAAAERLESWQGRFDWCFGQRRTVLRARTYLQGLMLHTSRKNVESMTLVFGDDQANKEREPSEVLAMQRFLTHGAWKHEDVQRELQAVFAEELAPSAGELGTVLVVDESSFVKRGDQSVGVARQHCGRLGKVENCQVGVFVIGATPAGRALLEHQLYLPKDWAHDQARRKKVRVPKHIKMQTKPQISSALVKRIVDNGLVKPRWVTADEGYGKDKNWCDEIDRLGLYYVAEVPKNKSVWLSLEWMGDDPTSRRATAKMQDEYLRSVGELAEQNEARHWHTIVLREGSNEPQAFEFAFFQVWDTRYDRQAGPPVWIIVRRNLDGSDYKYYVSNAPRDTPPTTLALVSGYRFRVEQYLGDGKGEFGMADYEARGWHSWHHHMSLVAMAHLFAMLTNRDLRQEEPRMTVECALRILQDALPRPALEPGDSLRIVEYHLNHTEKAAKSKRKKWLERHPEVKL